MSKIEIIIVILIALTVVLLVLVTPITSALIAHKTVDHIEITVEDKERVVGKKSGRYLIFTESEVFENTDSFWHWKFDSSDVYRDLEEGETYEVKVYGFRVPFLSWYRNIVEIK